MSEALDEFINRSLRAAPEERWPSVDAMVESFRAVRRAQLDFTPTRALSAARPVQEDWSGHAVALMEKGAYGEAETVARAEFESSHDQHAFLLMVTAAHREGRHFDCINAVESPAGRTVMESSSATGSEVRRLALAAYLEVRQVDRALELIDRCLADAPDVPELLLKKASLLALEAKYDQASQQLLTLNRRLPGRPAVLRRLVTVFEQMRDTGKAAAFLRAYQKALPDDPWAETKAEQYRALRLA